MIQYIKFGLNPSFLSRYNMRARYSGQNWTFQRAGVTLKIRSRSPKSYMYQLFTTSQQCIYASLIKIHPLVKKIDCRKGLFLQSVNDGDLENKVKVTQNLSDSLLCHSDTIYKGWRKSICSKDNMQECYFC